MNQQRRLLKIVAIGAVLAMVILAGGALYVWWSSFPPEGKTGPAAQKMARAFMDAVKMDRWPETGAITWKFAGRNTHVWDRRRGYARVQWKNYDVLLRLVDQSGIARDASQVPLPADESAEILKDAYKWHINDSFWLNPFASFESEGVQFATVDLPKEKTEGLLVTYPTGGVTPGDKYLWLPGQDGLPRAFQMWVQVVKVGGLEFSWEDFQPIETGVLISRHHAGVKDLEITDVHAASTLAQLIDGPDPFAPPETSEPSGSPRPQPSSESESNETPAPSSRPANP